MRIKGLAYVVAIAFLAWATVTPASAGGPRLSEEEMAGIQAGTVITSNSLVASGDASGNSQVALWLEFSNIFLGESVQETLNAVNNVVAADSQVGAQSNIVSMSGSLGSSNTIGQANVAGVSSTIDVFNSLVAGLSASPNPETGNSQTAEYVLGHTLTIDGLAQGELVAVNNVVVAGSQAAAQSNIVGVGTQVGSTTTVAQANSASATRDVRTANILSAGHEALGNSQTAVWIESSKFVDPDVVCDPECRTVNSNGLGDIGQQSLQAVNNMVAVDSQAAAQSNIMTVGSSIGNSNTIAQANSALAASIIDVFNFHESGTGPFIAPGIGGDDGDSDNLTQFAGYFLFHDASMHDAAQENLKAVNNVVASGAQVAAQSNVLTIGSSTGDHNRVSQSNSAVAVRSATTLNINLNGDDAAAPGSPGHTSMTALWFETGDGRYVPGITVNLLNDAQHFLQAVNNVVAAGSQVAAQSNVATVAGTLGGLPGGGLVGETDNAIAQANRAGIGSSIRVGNFVEAGRKTLAQGVLDQHGYALGLKMDAEYVLNHAVTIDNEAQRSLQAVNNVVAAGSQVAAQSNVIAIGQSTGAQDNLAQSNQAGVSRVAVTRNDIVAPGEPDNDINNQMSAQWLEQSRVQISHSGQANLTAVNNVVAADSEVAAQSNVLTIGSNVASNSQVSQANSAVVASAIDVGNSIAPGIALDQATADANGNTQFARYFLYHRVDLDGSAQRNLQAVNNVVAAGSQVAAQSNLMSVGGQVGSSNTIGQGNGTVVARSAATTNSISAGGSANFNNQGNTDPEIHHWENGASWVEHSFVALGNSAQRELHAINNIVAADSQVASQSNLVGIGQTTFNQNTVGQSNFAVIASAIDVGNSIDAGRSTVTWADLQALFAAGTPFFDDENNPATHFGFVAEDATANDNSQHARYVLLHDVNLTGDAQRQVQAVNNVVAAGSQVAAQSNILTIGGTAKTATVAPSPSLSLNPAFTVRSFTVPSVDPPVVTANAGVSFGLGLAISPSLNPGANVGDTNNGAQGNLAIVVRSANTTNSIQAGREADRNDQNAYWAEVALDEERGARLVDRAQKDLKAINNIVAADSQVAGQSNLVAIGGSVSASNIVGQSNVAVVASAINVSSSITAGTNPARSACDSCSSEADSNSQSASYELEQHVMVESDAQRNLEAINNVVAAGSQVAAQSNLVAVGGAMASSNTISQGNVAVVVREADTTTSASSSGFFAETAGNSQSASWKEKSTVNELADRAQRDLHAVNNVVAADSQVAGQSNLVSIGSSLVSGNTIGQGNAAAVVSVIEVGNTARAQGLFTATADENSQSADYSLTHSLMPDDSAQENLKAINNIVAAGSQAAAQSNLVAIGTTAGSSNTVSQSNAAGVVRTASTTNTASASGFFAASASYNSQSADWQESGKVAIEDAVQDSLQAINNLVVADSQAAAQSNLVAVGSTLGDTNTITQANAALVVSVIDVENTASAGAVGISLANNNEQSAEYGLHFDVALEDGAQDALHAVNNVVAAGSQVAAQSNIVTVGSSAGSSNTLNQGNAATVVRVAVTRNTASASAAFVASADGNFQSADWQESSNIEITDSAQADLQAINNLVAADSQAVAQSNLVTVGTTLGSSNTISQANAAAVVSIIDVGNSVSATAEESGAARNNQYANYDLSHEVELTGSAQVNLQAINNVVAAGSQVAAQSNIVTVGGTTGSTNTITQSNAAAVVRVANTTNDIHAGGGDFNTQAAYWTETSHVILWDEAQLNLHAINNVVAADSQVAAQSNLVSVGSDLGSSNSLTQVNVIAMANEINVTNGIEAGGTGNQQLASYFLEHNVSLDQSAQFQLRAINNVVAAGSQVGASSNIATFGGSIGSSNGITQLNVMSISR